MSRETTWRVNKNSEKSWNTYCSFQRRNVSYQYQGTDVPWWNSRPSGKAKPFFVYPGREKTHTGNDCSTVTLLKVEDKNLNQVYTGGSQEHTKHALQTNGSESHTVPVSEIIGVQKVESHPAGRHSSHNSAFTINFVKRATKHRWRVNHVHFHTRDQSLMNKWVDKIKFLLQRPEMNRPKSLMVFINPVGGKKKAPEIYRQKVAPYFAMAGIQTHVIMTERENHARDMIFECDLSKADGLISVGGDGMFTEILHGLMGRTYMENGMDFPPACTPLLKPSMKLGIIPAGSTDTVSWSLQGCGDPTTAALHIVVGDNLPMDVGTVHHGDTFIKYHVSLLAYGFYGDVLIDSEEHRWMGPRRYDWAGLKKFVNHKSYEGEFSYIPSSNPSSHLRDGVICKMGCTVCSESKDNINLQKITESGDSSEQQEWKTIKGKFLAINTFLISCRCRFSRDGPSPYAHLGDGYYDVVVIHDCSRANYFKHLYRCTQPGKDQFALPHVEVFRVKAFKFRPVINESGDAPSVNSGKRHTLARSSSWNCDGESVEVAGLDVVAHRQVVHMFARGVEEEITGPSSPTGTLSSSSCFQHNKEV